MGGKEVVIHQNSSAQDDILNCAGDVTLINITFESNRKLNYNYNNYAGMFINGDNPLTVITTENKNGRTLMIFKESYGNAFVPYMIDYYEEIVVIDIRKTTAGIANIITEHGITDALIINNIQAVSSLRSSLKAKLES